MGFYSCKDCDHREVGCHSTCPDYIRERAEHERERMERNKRAATNAGLNSQAIDAIYKIQKRRRGKV